MAAPNIVDVTSIYGRTAVLAVTTSATAILSGATDKVMKVNTLLISNIDGVNDAEITVDLYRSATAYHIAKTVVVPADAALNVLASSIYLEEGDALRLTANANSDLEAICSYEEIDDA